MAIMYIDAAASLSPKLSAGGIVITGENLDHSASIFLGEMDNHQAEWASLAFGVEEALKLKITSLIVYTDSKIIVDSFDKNFVKNKVFKFYFDQVIGLTQHMDMFIVSYTPRKKNSRADQIAKDRLYKEKKRL